MWFRGQINLGVQEFDTYPNLKYVRHPANPRDLTEWKRQGYTHEHMTGAMVVDREVMPNWIGECAKQIGLTSCGFTFYKMVTGDIMPRHADHFMTYQKIFNVDKSKVRRAVIVLQDWEPGHYFDIENEAIVNYKQGEYVLFDAFTNHSAANIGLKDRYTLQITGQLPSLEEV